MLKWLHFHHAAEWTKAPARTAAPLAPAPEAAAQPATAAEAEADAEAEAAEADAEATEATEAEAIAVDPEALPPVAVEVTVEPVEIVESPPRGPCLRHWDGL